MTIGKETLKRMGWKVESENGYVWRKPRKNEKHDWNGTAFNARGGRNACYEFRGKNWRGYFDGDDLTGAHESVALAWAAVEARAKRDLQRATEMLLAFHQSPPRRKVGP